MNWDLALDILMILALLTGIFTFSLAESTLENDGCISYWKSFGGLDNPESYSFMNTSEREEMLDPGSRYEYREDVKILDGG